MPSSSVPKRSTTPDPLKGEESLGRLFNLLTSLAARIRFSRDLRYTATRLVESWISCLWLRAPYVDAPLGASDPNVPYRTS